MEHTWIALLEPAADMATVAEVVAATDSIGWPGAIVTSVVVLVAGALIWKFMEEIL